MSLTTFLQQCLTGISLGGAYALIAIGYTCLLYTSLPGAKKRLPGNWKTFLRFGMKLSVFGIEELQRVPAAVDQKIRRLG